MTRSTAGYAAETDALLARLGPVGGPVPLTDLVADRDTPPDPELAGPAADVAMCADLYLPLRNGPTRVRVYRGGSTAPAPVLLWLHGGGFIGGSLADIDTTCRALANAVPMTVVSLDYRLAPENPFPAALDDTRDAIRWLSENGALLGGDGRVVAGGQSAGANLVLSACLAARGDGPAPARIVLCYPWLDDANASESWRLFDGTLVDRATDAWTLELYLAGQPVTELVTPLRAASLHGLPPALVLAAGRDPLRDDAREVTRRITEDGGRAELIEYPDTAHAFLNFPGVLTAARHAIVDIADHLRRTMELPGWTDQR